MGYPSRRESRPRASRRLLACVLSLALVLQGTAPALAAVSRSAPVSASARVSAPVALPPAEALRDAVAALGWSDTPAVVLEAPAATPSPMVPTGPQAAFDAVVKALAGGAGAPTLRAAAADAAALAPPAGREVVRRWAEVYGASVPDARKALPELARALGLIAENFPNERAAALAAQQLAAGRVAALAPPDFGAAKTVQPILTPVPLTPARPPLPAALSESEMRQRLGQSGDLSGGAADADAIARLDRLLERVSPLIPEGESFDGARNSRESKWAALEALRLMFDDAQGTAGPSAPRGADLAGTPAEAAVAARLARVEALNAELQANIASRDAAEAMLAVADRSRASALRERRGGRETLEFRKNFARLAMVMDLSYSLNLLNSADAAIGKMEALVAEKLKLIEKRRGDNGSA
ncbi:MAG: hypothetical protein COV48_08675, partial [Elusimicrobia bacterium CG11_big_fil_rev_8_21_14_0_20_64_6]